MSVLIKGMEMPTSCDECRLSVDYGCVPQNQWLNEEGTNKRLDNCPLIELPPHGRLIDADALSYQLEKQETIDGQPRAIRRARRIVNDFPTTIPAEEVEE